MSPLERLRALEASRLETAARYEATEAHRAAKRRTGKAIMWLGLLPFLLGALGVWNAATHMRGYLQGYAAAKAGKTIPEGLEAP